MSDFKIELRIRPNERLMAIFELGRKLKPAPNSPKSIIEKLIVNLLKPFAEVQTITVWKPRK
jgi:hypothetical protein